MLQRSNIFAVDGQPIYTPDAPFPFAFGHLQGSAGRNLSGRTKKSTVRYGVRSFQNVKYSMMTIREFKEMYDLFASDVLGSLKIGTERARAAQGIDLREQDGRNIIETGQRPEQMWMRYFLDSTEFDTMCDNIVSSVDNRHRIPITADLLAGASPLLRAGDCIQLVTKSGGVLTTEIMQQDVDAFPHMESRITTPDHTDWQTYTVDYDQVIFLRVTGWPEFVISGFPPDTSALVVTAELDDRSTFVVDPNLYRFVYHESPEIGQCSMAVRFGGTQSGVSVDLLYAMTTADGRLLLTGSGEMIAVKGREL